ncbi:hypothetical protein QAD02_016012 [Eretmocerus hayati]|uniref:Uncharacterized protein n=1 Tax=Eretmocerus hayati TaxID=131215 RepID=A0ACC2PA21_9HYME|nr:hypothetical protein QAD02_016012 [Eretmocerus hayati]
MSTAMEIETTTISARSSEERPVKLAGLSRDIVDPSEDSGFSSISANSNPVVGTKDEKETKDESKVAEAKGNEKEQQGTESTIGEGIQFVDAKLIAEEQLLKVKPKRGVDPQLIAERKAAQEAYDLEIQEKQYKCLMHLLSESKAMTTFILKKFDTNTEDESKKKSKDAEPIEDGPTPAKRSRKSKDAEPPEESASANRRRSTRARTSTPKVTELQESRRMSGRVKKRISLKEEDIQQQLANLSDDEADEKENADIISNYVKPNYFEGELRDYQKVGLNWLEVLYNNGLNGILADEMGLGKTIQIIALFGRLIMEKRVAGPYMIVVPLSTLANWASEFERFAPKLPVVVFYGNTQQRAEIRKKVSKKYKVSETFSTHPIVLMTYEMPMYDAKFLNNFKWRFIVVDEAQRLKNYQCQLFRIITSLKSYSRLLLTGTPLQNNLTELWSLLNFLLPQVFNNLGAFQSWFDAKSVQNEEGKKKFLQQEQEKHVVKTLREILHPFMLRRLKEDVCPDIPPIKEVMVYAPLTAIQYNLYSSIIKRDMAKLHKIEKEEVIVDVDGVRPKRKCTQKVNIAKYFQDSDESGGSCFSSFSSMKSLANDAEEIATRDQKSFERARKAAIDSKIAAETARKAADDAEKSTPALGEGDASSEEAFQHSLSSLKRKADLAEQIAFHDRKLYKRAKKTAAKSRIAAEAARKAADDAEKNSLPDNDNVMVGNSEIRKDQLLMWTDVTNVTEENVQYLIRLKFGNEVMMYRHVVNHPYIIHYPMDDCGLGKIDENLIKVSGKLLVLDAMLKKLKQRGHKILLFSTMTMVLDIIEDYLSMRDYEYVRLDGHVKYEDRRSNIDKFQTDPNVFLFLLTTRAGAVGLNLAAADTVIIYDSDWNPQCDLQAMARCHRIGQTKPVVVYRLCTKGTIDEEIIRRANAKRFLEKAVISKEGSLVTTADGLQRLKTLLEEETFTVVDSKKAVYTDSELDEILDRSDMIAKHEAKLES